MYAKEQKIARGEGPRWWGPEPTDNPFLSILANFSSHNSPCLLTSRYRVVLCTKNCPLRKSVQTGAKCVMLLTEIRLLLDVQDENYERKSSVAECALQLNTIVLRYGAALLGARSNNFQFAR